MRAQEAQNLLAHSISHQDLGELRQALRQGADVNFPDTRHNTPLMLCIRNHFTLGALVLGQSGADIHCLDKNNTNALSWSAFEREETVFEWLAKAGGDFLVKDDLGYCAATLVAMQGTVAMMRLLLEAGLDPNAQLGDDGKTPLLVEAVKGGNVDMAVFLVEQGADPSIKMQNGQDAWSVANDNLATQMRAAVEAREISIKTPAVQVPGRGGRL